MNSPILVGEDGSGAGLSAVGFEFGVDPNEDPELALVKFIKINLKSERNLLKKSRYKYLKTKSSMVIYKEKNSYCRLYLKKDGLYSHVHCL